MKRIALAIVTIAICAGVFAPVTLSLTAQHSVAVAPLTAYAAANNPMPKDFVNQANAQAKQFDWTTKFSCSPVHIAGCIEWILYFIPYKVGSWMMQAAALAFDSTAALTLSSALYSSTSFIADGWRVTRDIGNIFFILILMVAALALVLDIEIGHANPKKLVASVIFIALIVNFSFFITEAVIDVSNSLALVFYNQITVQNKDGDIANKRTGDTNGVVPPKSISEALVQTFQPQQLESRDFWDSLTDKSGSVGNQGDYRWGGCQTGAVGGLVIGGPIGAAIGCVVGGLVGYFIPSGVADPAVPDSIIISVEILVGIMYGVVAYSFFVAMLSFIGRLIGLWLAIIFAPLAFVSYIVPSARHIEGFGWSAWWSNLFTIAFAGPIYFFFLYLISLMAQSSFVSASAGANPQTADVMAKIMIVFLAFIFLIVMLLRATSYVKKASGEIGSMVFKGASLLGGLGLAATSGLIAAVGARSFGARAYNKLTDDNYAAAAGVVNTNTRAAFMEKYKGTAIEQQLKNMTDDQLASSSEFMRYRRDMERDLKIWQRRSQRSYDFRQTKVGNALSSATGMNMEGVGFLSTDFAAGGYQGMKARDAAKKQAFAKSLGADHDELVKLEGELVGKEDKERNLRSEIELARRELEAVDKTQKDGWDNANKTIARLEVELANAQKRKPQNKSGKEDDESYKKEVKEYEAKIKKIQNELEDVKALKDTFKEDVIEDWVRKNADVVSKQRKLNELINPSKVWKDDDDVVVDIDEVTKKEITKKAFDLGLSGQPKAWNEYDLKLKAKKANGKLVSDLDVATKKLRTEALSTTDIRRAMERTKTERMKSFYLQEQYMLPFKTEHVERDDFGQIKSLGHMKPDLANTEAVRMWQKSVRAGLIGGNLISAVRKGDDQAIINSIERGFKNVITGDAFSNITQSLENIHRAIPATPKLQGNPLAPYSIAQMERRATEAASDLSHEIHLFHSKYNTPGGGFGNFLTPFSSGNSGHPKSDSPSAHPPNH